MGIVFDEVVGTVGPRIQRAAEPSAGGQGDAPAAPPPPDPEHLRRELHLIAERRERLHAD